MNRIYQGKVTNVEILKGKDADGKPQWKNLDGWQDALWQHHQLFQDAVNYYIVCLLALASSNGNPLTKIRQRIEDTAGALESEYHIWTKVSRKGAVRPGLRDSVAKYLTPENKLSSPKECFEAVLHGNEASHALLDAALMLMLKECSGKDDEGAIKEIGRGYCPRFCDPTYTGNFTGDSLMQAREELKLRLPATLYHPNTTWNSPVIQEFDVYAIATPDNRNPSIKGDEAKQRLRRAVEHWQAINTDNQVAFERLMTAVDALPDTIRIPRYIGSSAKGGVQSRLFALLIFKYVESSPFTFGLLKQSFPPVTDFSILEKPLPHTAAVDPVKESRGNRGYVFKAFTGLPQWRAPKNKNEASLLKQFDIAAFKYALTTLHQIDVKEKERKEKKAKIDERLRAMRNPETRAGWKMSAESESDDRPPLLAGDERIARLEAALASIPVVQDLCDVEGQAPEYGLLPRTIRGFAELSKQWNDKVKTAASPSAELRDKVLIPALNAFKQENVETIGSDALFRALAEPENWIVWKTPDAETKSRWNAAGFADDPLEALTEERELQAESKRLAEAIRFTPADAVYSRRQYFFSDACTFPGKEYCHETNALRVTVPLMHGPDGNIAPERVRLSYSAPRLLRDALRATTNEPLDKEPWSQPMMEALGLKQEAIQDLTDCAIALMPEQILDCDRRFLLNFPVTLDPLEVQRTVFKAAGRENLFSTRYDTRNKKHVLVSFWKQQCAGMDDKLFYLRWPTNKWPVGREAEAWYHRLAGFQALSVDLGQRDAGAWALIETKDTTDFGSKKKDNRPVPSRRIGTAGGRTWYAAVRATGMFKLPGEDAFVRRHRTALDDLNADDTEQGPDMREEFHGERGRSATQQEWKDAQAFCERLGFDAANVLGIDSSRKSFPELNDDLLYVLRRAQSRLARWQRWSWMVQDATRQKDILDEICESKDTPQAWKDAAAKIPVLMEMIKTEIINLRTALCRELEFLTNRILPLRGRKWVWVARNDRPDCRVLRETELGTDTLDKKLRGQRGLSLRRIQQLSELRRRCQSLNRSLQHTPGERSRDGASRRGIELPDPCPDILAKIDHIKEQRIHQLAHSILAQALGVKLRLHQANETERNSHDRHGEYDPIPGRKPVDFIVIEDLEFYVTTQRRAKSENAKLMLWSRRELRKKLIELCETYGLPVIETSPDYTSKFDARTGGPGFRATEITPDSRYEPRWRKMLDRWERHTKGETIGDLKSRREHERVSELFAMLDAVNSGRRSTDHRNPWRTLYAPQRGGTLFLAASGTDGPLQADINAAINLGFRAIAAPDCHEVHSRIRLDREANEYRPRRKTKREEARWKGVPKSAAFGFDQAPPTDLSDAFADISNVQAYDYCRLPGLQLRFVGGRGFWDSVNKSEWKRCLAVNAARLRMWGIEPPKDWEPSSAASKTEPEDDNIPM